MIKGLPLSLKQDTCNLTYLLFISVLASLIICIRNDFSKVLIEVLQPNHTFSYKIDGGFIIENGPKYCRTSVHDDIFGLTCGASKQLSFPIIMGAVAYRNHFFFKSA